MCQVKGGQSAAEPVVAEVYPLRVAGSIVYGFGVRVRGKKGHAAGLSLHADLQGIVVGVGEIATIRVAAKIGTERVACAVYNRSIWSRVCAEFSMRTADGRAGQHSRTAQAQTQEGIARIRLRVLGMPASPGNTHPRGAVGKTVDCWPGTMV